MTFALLATLSASLFCSCDSFSNMSDDDAYYIGAGIGTATRLLLDN